MAVANKECLMNSLLFIVYLSRELKVVYDRLIQEKTKMGCFLSTIIP